MQAVLEVRRVSKAFDRRTPILKGISFSLARGEMVALIGASGSGKSTLIRAIAGLVAIDKCSSQGPRPFGRVGSVATEADSPGEIWLFGEPMQRDGRIIGTAKQLRARVGVIFQQFNLVPRLSVLTNVCLGLLGRAPLLRGHHRPLQRSRQTARHAGAGPRRHRRACAQARQRAVGRPAAARRDRAHPGAGGRVRHRRRADRLARSELGAPRHGHPRRHEPPRPHHRAGVAASGRIRGALLPAHHRAQGGRGRVRRPVARADAGDAARDLRRRVRGHVRRSSGPAIAGPDGARAPDAAARPRGRRRPLRRSTSRSHHALSTAPAPDRPRRRSTRGVDLEFSKTVNPKEQAHVVEPF